MYSIEFLAVAWAFGSILGCAGVALSRTNFRIEGVLSWLLLLLLCGAPTAFAVIAIHYIPIYPDTEMAATAGFAMVFGAIWIHAILPKIIPDFQTNSMPSSLLLALFQGISIAGTYYVLIDQA